MFKLFFSYRKNYKLLNQILIYVVICSSFLALAATSAQLYIRYKLDIKILHENLDFVKKGYLDSIASSTYDVNYQQTRILLQGALNLENIEYLEVREKREGSEFIIKAGDPTVSRDYTLTYPLEHHTDYKSTELGTLLVVGSLKGVYRRLFSNFLIILGTNAVKAFLLSICFILVMLNLVIKPLREITGYTGNINFKSKQENLILSRKVSNLNKGDTIDQIVIAINEMNKRLKMEMDEQKKYETALKQKNDELKLIIKDKEVLLKEVHHRVKNNLQVVSSLIDLQIPSIQNEIDKELMQNTLDRVYTISQIHEELYKSDIMSEINFKTYTCNLFSHLLVLYNVERNKITHDFQIENILLSIELAIPCGLIINELITNSLKHAFPESRDGNIKILFEYDKKDNLYTLKYNDNGVGVSSDLDFHERDTLGVRLILALSGQLNGTCEFSNEQGFGFEMKFQGNSI